MEKEIVKLMITLSVFILCFSNCKKGDSDGLSECGKKINEGNIIMLQKLQAYGNAINDANCRAAEAAMRNQLKVLEECKGEAGATQSDIDELKAQMKYSSCD